MTTTRAIAVAAYLAAVASPAAADWRSIAGQLHAVLTAKRAPKAADWFADWTLGKVYSLDSLDVTFADGVALRVNLARAPGKAPRIAAACRVAAAFYRERTKRDSVPDFRSLVALSNGESFDPAACSALTADLRRTSYVPPRVRPVVTAESLVRMESELERRRAGLARAEAMPDRIAAHVIPLCLSWDARGRAVAELEHMKESAAMAESWRKAIEAGEAELATMRTALADPEPVAPVLSPLAVAAIAAMAEAEPCEPIAADPVEGMAEPVAASVPAEHVEPLAICPAVGLPCKVDCGFRSTCGLPAPREAMGSADPVEGMAMLISAGTIVAADLNVPTVEAIEAEPLAALVAADDADDWHADESTHPVIALCLSDKARAALFDRLQDGTFPADGRTAKGGAWRLTVADAEACAGLASVRFVGLPRKPYVRHAVPPVEAMGHVPAAAFIPGSTPPGPIVYHAAPAL